MLEGPDSGYQSTARTEISTKPVLLATNVEQCPRGKLGSFRYVWWVSWFAEGRLDVA